MGHGFASSTDLTLRQLPAIGLGLAMLLAPVAASASEHATRVPGGACKSILPQSRDTQLFSSDKIYNSSNDTVDIACPVTRNTQVASSIEYASVLTEFGVRCTLLLMNDIGNFYANPTNTSTESYQNGYMRLIWAAGEENLETPADGTYTFLCTLPPRTGVYSYSVVENVDED